MKGTVVSYLHLYHAEVSYEHLFAQASAQRRARALRYRNEQDRLRCLLAEALLRQVFVKCGYAERDFALSADEKGRPVLLGHDELFVSISHAGDFVVVALSCMPVGIDVERARSAETARRVAKRCFTEAEYRFLDAGAPDCFDDTFLRLWCGRESYLKYLGIGFAGDLPPFSVDPAAECIRLEGEIDRLIPLTYFTLDPRTLLCVCSEDRHLRLICI